ncbi:hypothetical protein AB1Y20_005977 [Prymnesium parvum]|uniref:Nucleotide-diphospho-sugar transferase domain-containing protein n=1 Tax=Prymnesium parvum TaxID=97485 RepID=A0AB34J3N5_PRYPA
MSAFASMCIGPTDGGLTPSRLSRCLWSACSLRSYHAPPTPFFYFVDEQFPAAAARFLRLALNATLLRSRRALAWPASPRFPRAPRRAYTFHKLRAWLLGCFDRVLYFDPDVFFTADAAHFFAYTPLAAAHFPMDPAGAGHFNAGERRLAAGLMVIRPDARELARILATWRAGNFTAARGFSDLTDQDVLIAAFAGRVHPMRICDNFRGAHRPYHRQCNATPALHNSFFAGRVSGELRRRGGPCGSPLRAALRLAEAELSNNLTSQAHGYAFAPLDQLPEIWEDAKARKALRRGRSQGRCSLGSLR